MSVLQPFQMLPFSKSIESQWRFRSDCFNDICDIPIIPKGKFIPFAIIANSDDVGDIILHCWDDPYIYTRTETFTRNNCEDGYGLSIEFSKTYESTINPQDAYNKAMVDPDYTAEGQAYANANAGCHACIPDFYDQFNSESELANYSGTNHPDNYSDAFLSIASGSLNIDESVESPRQSVLLVSRNYHNECAIIGNAYQVSFNVISNNANFFTIRVLGTETTLTTPSGAQSFIIEAAESGGGYTGEFEIMITSFGANAIHVEIDDLKLEPVEPNYLTDFEGNILTNNVGSKLITKTL